MGNRKYFGTDGIRGRVGEHPITPEFALMLGRALGASLGARASVVIGKDTRSSGYLLESALEAGLSASGVDSILVGPMPTPAIALLTRQLGAAAGIVISASHNPFEDNGIKLFSALGEKLDDALELEIEARLDALPPMVGAADLGRAKRHEKALEDYLAFLQSHAGEGLAAMRGQEILIDAAHGAGYRAAPHLFERLGFKVRAIGVQPNGLNINAGVGATDLSALKVEHARAPALAFALDGDGDRLQAMTVKGRLVDGDDLIYVLARHWQATGGLRGPVVGTVMTNLGIERAFEVAAIPFARAAVGDRYVHQMLKEQGGVLGGEASGHVLCLNHAPTGDGLLTAVLVLNAIAESGRDLDAWLEGLARYPQRTINVRLATRSPDLLRHPTVVDARRAAEAALGSRGRLILRASGTEPLIRVTVEAHSDALIAVALEPLADAVRAAANA